MKSSKFALTGIAMSLLSLSLNAQNDSSSTSETSTMPFQITLVPPMGTNGLASCEIENQISVNIIAGCNGGLDGVELGGFANILTKDMRGVQLAGFTNYVHGTTEGIQLAGFANMNLQRSKGLMLGGFTNHTQGSLEGIQVGGFSNQCMGSMEGSQIAGFSNIALDSAKGMQLSGFTNVANHDGELIQAAGFSNHVFGDLKGAQIAGFTNTAYDIDGFQLSGFYNHANTVNGFQLGFINKADSFRTGTPVGFVSFVKNGYRAFNVNINEMQWVEGQFRTGVPVFHNIFAVAISPFASRSGWAFGYGLGSTVWSTEKSDITLDLIAYHVNEKEIWTDAFNNLIRFTPKYTYRPQGGRFGIQAGPSINLLTSGKWKSNGDDFESHTAPYSMLKDETSYSKQKLWIGGQIGVTF